MSEERFSETERNCYYTSLVFDNHTQEELGTSKVVGLLNEQQSIIQSLKAKNDKLRELIKENVFGRYEKGSLADLKFKAIAYDDIIKVKLSYESEPKVIVYCNYGKRNNIMSFCQMFIPFGVAFEIKDVVDDES